MALSLHGTCEHRRNGGVPACHTGALAARQRSLRQAIQPMSPSPIPTLLPLVESYFRDNLIRARGASRHTVRAYRDTLRLLFGFIAAQRARTVSDVTLDDLRAPA